MSTQEIKRIENVPEGTYHFDCLRCGKPLTLWFNGGELDTMEHCGVRYSLESRGIDFVASGSSS